MTQLFNESALQINLRSSTYFFYVLLSISFFLIINICLAAVAFTYQMLLITLVLLQLTYHYQKHIKCTKDNTVTSLSKEADSWFLLYRSGKKQAVSLAGGSICTRFIIVLRFKVLDRRRVETVIIFPDSTDSISFRHLRVHLKHIPVTNENAISYP